MNNRSPDQRAGPTRRTTPFPGYRLPAPPQPTGRTHYGQTVPAPSTPTDTSLLMTATHQRSNVSKASYNLLFAACTTKIPVGAKSYTHTVTTSTLKKRVETENNCVENQDSTLFVCAEDLTKVFLVIGRSGPSDQRQKHSFRQHMRTNQHLISHVNTVCFTWRQHSDSVL